MNKIHILLIDDHAMIRSALRMVLGASFHNAEIFEAGSLSEAMQISPVRLDVILLDVKMPGENGIDGLSSVKRKWPDTPVVILSSQDDPETVRTAIARGADDFISKAESAEKISALLKFILDGEHHSPTAQSLTPGNTSTPPAMMTPRQCEVLDLLCEGNSNKVIAKELAISEHTVRGHVQMLLQFFSVSSRSEAVFAARQRRLTI